MRRLAAILSVALLLSHVFAAPQTPDPKFAAGGNHTGVILEDATLWVAGDNYYGQLGDGTSTDKYNLSLLSTDTAAVVNGATTTFWIKTDRSLWATGSNSYGMIGDGGTGSRYIPAQVAVDVAAVAAGDSHMAFLKNDGTLWTTGSNGSGQLGTGNTTSRATPGQIATNVNAVAAGSSHTLFLKGDGTLWAAGYNYNGQLGDGTTTSRSTPVQVASSVTAIAAGGSSSYFIKSDGTLWAMGNNYYGQLGDGTTYTRSTPLQVASSVKAVTAGPNHCAFLKNDGSLWTVGYNSYQELADSTTNTRYVPTQVATSVASVVAGGDHTIYRTNDGTTWCAGVNYNGDFGLGNSNSSFPVPVRMVGLPVITSGIGTPKTVNPGAYVSFSVTAYGAGALTFQWTRNGQPIQGATSSSYNFNAAESLEGNYSVNVTGRDGTLTSDPVSVTVNDPVLITTPPQPAAVMPGQPATFTVAATGTGPLSYQWRKSGSNISGETNPTLTLLSVSISDAATYTCAVTNGVGTVPSAGAALTVGPAITTQPQNRTATSGSSTQFSVTATGTSVSYQWRWNGNTITGATSSTYTFSPSKASEGTYDVVVTNAAGSVTSAGALLSVNEGVVITSQPQGAVLQPGGTLSLQVSATGTGPLSYQWKFNNGALPGQTNSTLSIPSVTASNAGLYTCAVSNVVGTVTSISADIKIGPAITPQPANQVVNPGASVTFSVQAAGSGPLTYEWRKDGTTVGTGPALWISSATEADEGLYTVLVTSAYGSALSAPAQLRVNDVPTIKTQPQPVFAHIGETATFSVALIGNEPVTYQWRHAGVPIPNATYSFIGIPVGDSTVGSYDVIVTNSAGSTTSDSADLALDHRPVITKQPAPQSVHSGASITLSVEAASDGALSYQWFHDNIPVPGGNAATLPLNNVGAKDAGNYSVQVSDAAGATSSDSARVELSDWAAIAGVYQALFIAQNPAAGDAPLPGRLTMTVTTRGSFSGRLEFDGLNYPLSGVLGNDFSFTKVLNRPSQDALHLSIKFSPNGNESRLDAEVDTVGATPTALLTTMRNSFDPRLNPAPQAGRYVMATEPGSDANSGPLAPGYAAIRVSTNGAVSLVGKLPDGAKLACGGMLGEDGAFPCYQGLYRLAYSTAGSFAGSINLSAIPSDQAVSGDLWWKKPVQPNGQYSSGFSIPLAARGGFYKAPARGEILLEVPQGSSGLGFNSRTSQGETLFQQNIALSAQNRFSTQLPNPQRLTLQLDSRTGLIRGRFIEPKIHTARTFTGILIPGSDALGFYSAGSVSGAWQISPK